jgi:hypothetical protein
MHVGDLYYVDVVGARNSDPYGLYESYDADRVRSLNDLADRLASPLEAG